MNYPKVSIIILNWNGLKDTIECLESLKQLTYPNYEVIVVDNGSTDDSVKFIKELTSSRVNGLNNSLINNKSTIRLIENRTNLGYAEGNNIAIRQVLREGESDFILLLNNDTVVEKNFLSELVKVAQSEKEIGILGPKIYYHDYQGRKNVIQSAGSMVNLCAGRFPSVERLDEVDNKDIKEPRSVDFVIGACLLVKTEVVKKIGLLDKRFFCLFEDTDWCLRAKKVGFKILYVPSSIIWHKKSQSVKKISEVYYYTRNLFWLESKHANIFQLLCFLLHYFIFIFPQYFFGYMIIKRDYDLLKNYTRGVVDGILGKRVMLI